jgi:hypothetical protein
MTRLFLAAGVAALALAAPASAKPGGNGGGHQNSQAASAAQSGGGGFKARGGGGGERVQMQRGGGGFRAQSFDRGNFRAQSFEHRGNGGMRFERSSPQRFATMDRGHGRNAVVQADRGRNRVNVARPQRIERQQARNFERPQLRGNRIEQVRNREAFRNQVRGNGLGQVRNGQALRNEIRGNRVEQLNNRQAFRNALSSDRIITRDDLRNGRFARAEAFSANARGYGVGGCPPGLESKGCMPPGQAAKLLGRPLSDAARIAALGAVPVSARYLYPDTNDYFYRYGDGYLYRVDRGDQLISALLPLAFGGSYMPGSYLPNYYMNSYVPDYYGLSSFYPATYNAFDYGYGGYGYDNLCNRYANGLIYRVDCLTGMIVDVIPLYAGGYGVGQLLPSGYGYYNVPTQYRSLYYDTSDYGYWYAPGAIYQYDPSSSLITSVAALLSPNGFAVGQPLPMGYDVYNVPYDYRATYYDTPTAWYRYNNGYIYQVDPTTQLVTAIVASILT